LYSFDLYWHARQQLKGHPTIENRYKNDLGDGRVAFWLQLISQFGPSKGCVIEVGCAHGVLLAELNARGYECIGVEPDKKTAEWTRASVGVEVVHGFFPEVELPQCDLFLAFDVLEHSPNPEAFLKGASRLLRPKGIAIIQTPIERYGFEPPFGDRFNAAFDDIEHLFLFTDHTMGELARRAGLRILSSTERLWLHHEICILTKP